MQILRLTQPGGPQCAGRLGKGCRAMAAEFKSQRALYREGKIPQPLGLHDPPKAWEQGSWRGAAELRVALTQQMT